MEWAARAKTGSSSPSMRRFLRGMSDEALQALADIQAAAMPTLSIMWRDDEA
jgi:hypothetical protein